MVQKKLFLCLDVGGTKILGVVFDNQNNILFEHKIKTKSDNIAVKPEQNILDVLEKLFEYSQGNGTVVAISVGVPGMVNSITGEVILAPNINWKNFRLKDMIYDKYQVKCFVDNDVNLGLLGEWKYGQASEFNNCVGIFIGTGIGGSIIINRKLYTGSNYFAGEIGHIIIDKNGHKCTCGKTGCLEAFVGKVGITEYIKNQIKNGRKTIFSELIQKDELVRGNYLKKALLNKDDLAFELVERMADYLSIAAGTLIQLLNPDAVIFGGGIIESTKDIMIPKIITNTQKYCFDNIYKTTTIISSKLEDYCVVYGAKALIEEDDGK